MVCESFGVWYGVCAGCGGVSRVVAVCVEW
jgi:hypothetical protein